jgi:hypothetical protein
MVMVWPRLPAGCYEEVGRCASQMLVMELGERYPMNGFSTREQKGYVNQLVN